MSDAKSKLETLESGITAANDTHANLVGLIEKLASMQLALDEAGFKQYAASVGEAFGSLTEAAGCLEQVAHDAELERNRIRNES